MMNIHCYSSGSGGNLYTVTQDSGEMEFMLDPGLTINRVQKLAGFFLPDAVLLTHEHKDHSKAIKDLLKLGCDCYMTAGTAKALGIKSHRCHLMRYGDSVQLGNAMVSIFETEHDAAEPCGFLLDDGEDRVLYATDTYYVKYRFRDLTKIMIECNHSYKILEEQAKTGNVSKFLINRLMRSHFALENVIKFFQANDLSKVKEIWLIHLSQDNADPELFQQEVAKATGKPVYIAGRNGGRK